MSGFEESLDKVKRSLGSTFSSGDGDENETDGDKENLFSESMSSVKKCKLSWKNRVIGFIISIVIAGLFAVIGCALAGVSPIAFAVLFTVGTIAAFVSTFFLVGPIDQGKKLIDFHNCSEAAMRTGTLVVLLIAIVLAIVCGAYGQAFLAILCCIVEFAAFVWYAIILIPFAWQFIKRGCRSLCSSITG